MDLNYNISSPAASASVTHVPGDLFSWDGLKGHYDVQSPYSVLTSNFVRANFPSANSAVSRSDEDVNSWWNIPSTSTNLPPILTPVSSAQAQAQRDHYNSEEIRSDPENQVITDAATEEENQGYIEGLASSIGELMKQQMSYNERRDKMYMEWQEAMSNTAYQRAMADMKAAGLNPILAYSQGGASTPSVTSSNYSLGGGDTLTDFVNMITNGASNLLRAIANFLPSGQAAKLLEVSKEISYSNGRTSVHTSNIYG